MFVLGVGLGMVMQVLVLAVQNAVEYRDLGTGTSGATFFRSIGSSVGVADLRHRLHRAADPPPGRRLPAGAVGRVLAPALAGATAALGACPPAVQTWFLDGYVHADPHDLPVRRPVGLLAFVLAWLIPEVKLRDRREPARARRGVRAAEQPHVARGAAPPAVARDRPRGPAAGVRSSRRR